MATNEELYGIIDKVLSQEGTSTDAPIDTSNDKPTETPTPSNDTSDKPSEPREDFSDPEWLKANPNATVEQINSRMNERWLQKNNELAQIRKEAEEKVRQYEPYSNLSLDDLEIAKGLQEMAKYGPQAQAEYLDLVKKNRYGIQTSEQDDLEYLDPTEARLVKIERDNEYRNQQAELQRIETHLQGAFGLLEKDFGPIPLAEKQAAYKDAIKRKIPPEYAADLWKMNKLNDLYVPKAEVQKQKEEAARMALEKAALSNPGTNQIRTDQVKDKPKDWREAGLAYMEKLGIR